MMLIFLIV